MNHVMFVRVGQKRVKLLHDFPTTDKTFMLCFLGLCVTWLCVA